MHSVTETYILPLSVDNADQYLYSWSLDGNAARALQLPSSIQNGWARDASNSIALRYDRPGAPWAEVRIALGLESVLSRVLGVSLVHHGDAPSYDQSVGPAAIKAPIQISFHGAPSNTLFDANGNGRRGVLHVVRHGVTDRCPIFAGEQFRIAVMLRAA